jgi:hypothetical protein
MRIVWSERRCESLGMRQVFLSRCNPSRAGSLSGVVLPRTPRPLPSVRGNPASGGASARRIGSHARVCGPSALRNGRGSALAEEFGSVTRRFPWSVIAIEALSPMVFIHTRRIIIVPGHQHLLGFLAPLFESHRRLVWVMDRPLGDRSTGFFFAYGKSQHFDLGQELFNLRSSSCHAPQRSRDPGHANPR